MTRSPQKARRIKLSNSCNFLFVGRLEKVKGIDILLSACQILAKKNINFHLYALGTGSLRPIQNLNEVTFVGQGSAQKVAAYMKSADFLVIPSRSESLPLVFVEAARAGLPVIATNVGDCHRLLEKYHAGLKIRSINSESVAKTLEKAVNTDRNQFQNGLKHLANDFDLTLTTRKLVSIVRKNML
jgi:glycosyltransferase involved in cell wall biosynthesis